MHDSLVDMVFKLYMEKISLEYGSLCHKTQEGKGLLPFRRIPADQFAAFQWIKNTCQLRPHFCSLDLKLRTWSTMKDTSGDTTMTRLLYLSSFLSNMNGKTPFLGAVVIITVWHRPFPVQFAHVSGQFHSLSAVMAKQKRSGASCSSSSASKQSKRQVSVATCEKWQREFNCSYQTLRYDVDATNRSLVDPLWCKVCRTYQTKTQFKRNFSAM